MSSTVIAMAAAVVLVISLQGKDDPAVAGRLQEQVERVQLIRAWGARAMGPTDDGHGMDVPDGEEVHEGQILNARGANDAKLSFSGGTVLQLTPQAKIEVKTIGAVQSFRLARGRLHADIAPLDAGQRFLIETPDGEIEVHGTVFDLAVIPPQPGCSSGSTRVTVAHGDVEVRSAGHDDHVLAGQHWPPECTPLGDRREDASAEGAPSAWPAAESSPAPHSEPGRMVVPPGRIRRLVAEPSRHAIPSSSPSELTAQSPLSELVVYSSRSELALQNDLFAAAMTAKGRGHVARALEMLDQLIVRFPRGQLVEAANAEKMRLRQRAGDLPSARREARDYLGAFPDGFARAEALLILGPAAGGSE